MEEATNVPTLEASKEDIELLALCAWREARGEGEAGMRAVMHVVKNRADHWYRNFASPVHQAIYMKWQFTSMSNPADSQYKKFPVEGDHQMEFCRELSYKILNGLDQDPTSDALYYANLRYVSNNSWFYIHILKNPRSHPCITIIGSHNFYA